MTDVLNRWVLEPVDEIPEARRGGTNTLKKEVQETIDTLKANPNRPFRVFVADNSATINGRYATIKTAAERMDLHVELGTRKEGENFYSLYAKLIKGERL